MDASAAAAASHWSSDRRAAGLVACARIEARSEPVCACEIAAADDEKEKDGESDV